MFIYYVYYYLIVTKLTKRFTIIGLAAMTKYNHIPANLFSEFVTYIEAKIFIINTIIVVVVYMHSFVYQ